MLWLSSRVLVGWDATGGLEAARAYNAHPLYRTTSLVLQRLNELTMDDSIRK